MNGHSPGPARQKGAALVVGLVLLVVLTILAVTGVFSSTMEMRMAANTQLQEQAFQAAEVAIEEALANPDVSTSAAEVVNFTPNPNSPDEEYSFTLGYVCTSSVGLENLGTGIGTGFSVLHFRVDATGRTLAGNAEAEHTQGFSVRGPLSPEDC